MYVGRNVAGMYVGRYAYMCLCMYVGRGDTIGGWVAGGLDHIYYIYSILYFRHDMVQTSTTICYKQGWQRRIELAEIVLGSREYWRSGYAWICCSTVELET